MKKERFIEARLTPNDNRFYKSNVLIEALPAFDKMDMQTLYYKLLCLPDRLDNLPADTQKQGWLLSHAMHFFVPLPRHLQLFQNIDTLIRLGYIGRSPLFYPREIETSEITEENKYPEWDAGVPENTTALTAAVMGCSGIGKTYAVRRILQQYPRVLRHPARRLHGELVQLTWLHVQCPPKGSPISLCISLLRQIDECAGCDHEPYIRERMTLDKSRKLLIDALKEYHVGIIAIDEIQNLLSSQAVRDALFNFVVDLSSSINIPVIFIGTPKMVKLLTRDFRMARRFCTLGFFDWGPLHREADAGINLSDWDLFCEGLNKLSILDDSDKISLNEDVKDAIFKYSQGITDVTVKLYALSQIACLQRGRSHLDERSVEEVFNTYFKVLDPVISAMRRGDLAALEKYDDIRMMSDEEFDRIARALIKDTSIAPRPPQDLQPTESEQIDHDAQAIVGRIVKSGHTNGKIYTKEELEGMELEIKEYLKQCMGYGSKRPSK